MKTWEMIKMLSENTKLRFDALVEYPGYIQAMQVFKYGNAIALNIKDGSPKFLTMDGNIMAADWQLVREPVPVWEAIKALMADKKSIRGVNRFGEFVISPEHLESTQKLAISNLKDCLWYIEEPAL